MFPAIEPLELEIPARDGYLLGATLFRSPDPRGIVVVNGATAVPHRFYRRFATALAQAGFSTVTYDYRGIAASRRGPLRSFSATATDWALLDMAGVIDWTAAESSTEPLSLVGHSFGGQVPGLLDNPQRIDRMVTVSAQSGYWRLQGGEQKLVVALHVSVTLPLTVRLLGYAPWGRFSTGEDLPGGVARQWSKWCRHPEYLFGDDSLPLERFDRFTAPVLAFSFSDDKWGTERSVDVLMGHYRRVERRHVRPSDLGLDRIGHMGFFRPESRPLWDEAIAWLSRNR